MESNDKCDTRTNSYHASDVEKDAGPVFDGFESLLEQVQLLGRQHASLERKLASVQAQYRDLATKYAPSSESTIQRTSEITQIGSDIGKDLNTSDADMIWALVPLRNDRTKDEAAVRRILLGKRALDIYRDRTRNTRGLAADPPDSKEAFLVHESPQRKLSNSRSDLEQDFTTPGVEGNLQCPFAHMAGDKPGSHPSSGPPASTIRQSGRLPTPPHGKGSHTLVDPIEAEFHGDAFSSPPPSVTGSASKCPIRFLDQHSPEEVAKYFENHKHEIPRSHEICVKRYQSNAESIRQLDAKYGSLVSMIQGLGMKHQPLLPADQAADMRDRDVSSADRVGKWAEAISERLDGREDGPVEHEQDDRQGHFDRPLKEIRVGESPSRPWGISVLAAGDPAMAAFSSHGDGNVEEHQPSKARLPRPTSMKITGGCPFGFDQKQSSQPPEIQPPASVHPDSAAFGSRERPQPDRTSEQQQKQRSAPQMVFTGPVFIGYAPEQAMAFAQQLGMGPKSTS